MFKSAFTRLVFMYMAIVFVISMIFSVVLYEVSTISLEKGLRRPGNVVRQMFGPNAYEDFKEQRLKEQKAQIISNIVLLNILTLSAGFILSYLLARRTLGPLEEAHKRQTRFTADVAHELRTPLAVIRTENEVALRDKSITKQETKEVIESNLEETVRLQGLVDTMLQLASSDEEDVTLTTVELTGVIKAVVKRYSARADEADVKIINKTTKSTVLANKDQLDQIIAILLDNAIKYSSKGQNVTIGTSGGGKNGVKLEVVDHGTGIADKDKPYIFDRFYRSESARTRTQTSGYGLGLALAKKLSENNKASIAAQDTKGGGSTFVIILKEAPARSDS